MDLGALLNGLLGGIGGAFVSLFNALVQAVVNLITWLIAQIPHLPLWPGPSASVALSLVLSYLANALTAWNFYVCLNLAIVLGFTYLGLRGVAAAWHVIRWLLTKLPFIGGAE